jgi:shikimate dehydrogenase
MHRYAVVGHPIAHSRSPEIHAAFARATGQDIVYERLLAPLDGFVATVSAFAQSGGRGCNVTTPFKQEAFALCTERTPRAELAGAVNTLSWADGRWKGDTTDGVGLVRDLANNLGLRLRGRSILLLGAGGATRGVVEPLLAQSPARLCIANRTIERAEALVDVFAALGPVEAVAPAALREPFDIVVNATSAELSGEASLWPDAIVGTRTLAYDMSYANQPTAFMRWARERGAAGVADGLGMLIEQAAESFFVWRGVRPDTRPVFALLRPR